MPELPEVETIVRELNQKIKGKKIKTIEVHIAKMINLSVAVFRKKIVGATIRNIRRRAKIIIIDLGKADFVIVHLKMTGQLIYQAKSGQLIVGGHSIVGGLVDLPNRYTQIIWQFTDGSHLFYNDLRKFGWFKSVSSKQLAAIEQKYGIEPLSSEYNLKSFEQIIKCYPRKKIKQLLLDQELIAGIGNIYADESCWCAQIKPTRPAGSLKSVEIRKLFYCLPKILKLSINHGGTSANTYVRTDGRPGGFVPYLKVYGRAKQKCRRCGQPVQKIKLSGRGTHYCDQCQK
ncbi:MAG: bifunctional DNA-formamidopyrimidine glycosylase/DNA-(apurinic or apyrimidinic site) lyase [Patescibacteria group bacterium]